MPKVTQARVSHVVFEIPEDMNRPYEIMDYFRDEIAFAEMSKAPCTVVFYVVPGTLVWT